MFYATSQRNLVHNRWRVQGEEVPALSRDSLDAVYYLKTLADLMRLSLVYLYKGNLLFPLWKIVLKISITDSMHHRALLDDFISTTPHYFYFGVNFHWGLVWPGILSAHNAHPTLLLYRNIHWFESYSSSWVSLRHLEVYSVYNIDIRDTVFWSPCFMSLFFWNEQ